MWGPFYRNRNDVNRAVTSRWGRKTMKSSGGESVSWQKMSPKGRWIDGWIDQLSSGNSVAARNDSCVAR